MSISSLMLLQRTYRRPNSNAHHEGRDNTIELSVEDPRSLYSDSTRCLFSYMGNAFSSSKCYCAIFLCCPQASGGPYTWPVSNHVHITRKSRSGIICGYIGQLRNARRVPRECLSHSALSRLIASPTNHSDGQILSGDCLKVGVTLNTRTDQIDILLVFGVTVSFRSQNARSEDLWISLDVVKGPQRKRVLANTRHALHPFLRTYTA